ncbi:MAG: hypothetical protein IPP23_13450 [Sphingomonadales bacterium]|nr:hypothetical protein [Sphingomonadales bacterium]
MTENGKASLLVLDASYTLEMIKERGMENSVTCRDLSGKPVWHDMGPRHTFIEGKVGRFSWLSFLFPVNFLIGQIGLFLSLWALIKREDIRVIRVGDPLYLGLFGLALKAVTGVPMLIRISKAIMTRCAKIPGAPCTLAFLHGSGREKVEAFCPAAGGHDCRAQSGQCRFCCRRRSQSGIHHHFPLWQFAGARTFAVAGRAGHGPSSVRTTGD